MLPDLNQLSAGAESRGSWHWLEAVPLLIAALYYLLSPFFVGITTKGLCDYLDGVDEEWSGDLDAIPPHRSSEALGGVLEWVMDAPQLVPSVLLPLLAVMFVIDSREVVAVVLAVTCLLLSVAALWIYRVSPLQYRAIRLRKYKLVSQYTLVSMVGLLFNLAAAVLVVAN